jgi:hypothetical protein
MVKFHPRFLPRHPTDHRAMFAGGAPIRSRITCERIDESESSSQSMSSLI